VSGEKYTLGIDFGTLSGRVLVVRVGDGHELASAEHVYRHGVVTDVLPGTEEVRLPSQWALQVPADYIDVLRTAVPAAVAAANIDPTDVIGIGTDFTACTMVPVRYDGVPLCEFAEFAERPHAYAKLWRHHSAQPQADRINAVAAQRGEW
jgi:L-ribulokinase